VTFVYELGDKYPKLANLIKVI